MERLNEQEIRKFWHTERVSPSGENMLTEIRIIGSSGKTYSGYFRDVETLLSKIQSYSDSNIYYTMNILNDALDSREQLDNFVFKPKATTSAQDIIGRKMVVIDIDPVRPASTNASDEELGYAKEMANNVIRFLKSQGFNKPIVALSGNGCHIKLACSLSNSPDSNELVKNFLAAISMLFSNEKCHCDEVLFDPNRIIRLQGTYSRKGNSKSKNRPQRESYYVQIPDEFIPNDRSYFQKVADMLPKKETPNRQNNFSNERFDLDGFISKHGISVSQVQSISGGTKYILEHCVFDSNHKGKDAMIFQRSDGAIGYKCFHNSCSSYTWRDVRLMFEPDAYNKKEYKEFQQKRLYNTPYNERLKPEFIKEDENIEEKGKKWLNMSDIKYVDITQIVSIPTGYTDMDKDITGLLMGDITVMSGISGAGKSSWLGCVSLNAINKGFKVAMWSGELQDFRLQSWMHQIAAGKNYVRKKEGYNNLYYAPKNIGEKINLWMDDKLFIYNNSYGSKWEQLFIDIKDVVEKEGVQMIILDNLMALNITGYAGTQYNQQTAFINDLKEYSKEKHIHTLLVAHPRKDVGLLRKESISGTADITNLADNVIIIHRVGKDFDTRAREFLSADDVGRLLQYSCVIELCKNRSFGVVDKFYGMHYEPESRRLKNEISEHIIYGWEESGIQEQISFKSEDFANLDFDYTDDFPPD